MKFSLDIEIRSKFLILKTTVFAFAAKHCKSKESGFRKKKNIKNWLLTFKPFKRIKKPEDW